MKLIFYVAISIDVNFTGSNNSDQLQLLNQELFEKDMQILTKSIAYS